MTPKSHESLLRGLIRMPRLPVGPRPIGWLCGLVVAALAISCTDSPTQPKVDLPPTQPQLGRLGVYASSAALPPSGTLVVQVSGPGIVKSDGSSPDTLAFNIAMANGVASGSITVPAGPQRVITVRAYDGLTETHRGSVITDIVVGANPTIVITLVPLVGNVSISVSIGTTIVIVRPAVATLGVGDTLRMTAEIHDQNGALVSGRVRWATLNPGRASVDTLGLVTMRDTGEVQIVATYGTVGGSAKLSGTPQTSAVAYFLTWNGSVNTNWSEPNNWTPHGIGAARVPTLGDSVVIAAGPANQPRLDACQDQSVRDLRMEPGSSLAPYCGYGINVYRSATSRGSVTASVYARPGATLAGVFTNLYVYGDTVSLADSVRAGTVEVNAASAGLLLRGHRLVANSVNIYNGGTITMVEGDTIEVNSDVSWQGGDESGKLTGGVMLFHGTSFYGYRYKASGTNRLVFDRAASGQQTISGFDYVNGTGRNAIQRWDVHNRDGVRVCGYISVNDSITFRSMGTPMLVDQNCGGYPARALGPVIADANVTISSYLWELWDATATSLIAGAWNPTYTDIHAANAALKPGLGYRYLRFYAPYTFSAPVAIANNLEVDGSGLELSLGGHRVTVGGNLEMTNSSLLTMTNAADTLLVAGTADFNYDTRAAELTRLTAGLLEVGGTLNGTGFNAAGTHTLRLTSGAGGSTYLSGLNFLSYDQGVQNLELASGANYGTCGYTRVRGTITLRTGSTLGQACGGYQLRIDGDLVTEAGSTFNPYNVLLYNPTGTSKVNGAFTPTYTSIYTSLAAGQLKAGLGYTNMGIFAAASLPGDLAVNGDLAVTGAAANLTLNGHRLNVTGRLDVNTSGVISMTSAADSLILGGAVNWSGAGSEVGKITAGVMVLRGDSFCASNFYASGSHKTVFDRTGTPVRVDCVSGGTPQNTPFAKVEVRNYGVLLSCYLYATGGVHVLSGARIEENCGSGNLWVQDTLFTDAGSLVGNGASYPGGSQLGVVLADSSGTMLVNGSYVPHWTYFTALHSNIKPSLGYHNVRIDRSTTFRDSVTFDGNLNIINDGTILTMGGRHVNVRGSLDFSNNSLIRMDNAADTLMVATGDETAHLYWNGADNSGLLTNGVVLYAGNTFYGPSFKASGTNRFVFTGTAAGAATQVQGAPIFQKMEMRGTRSVTLNDRATVQDTLLIATATQLTGNNFLLMGSGTGTLVTAEGSDVVMPNVYLDGPTGTRNVQGRFRPTHTWFRSATPTSDALKPGLEYGSLHFEGPYDLMQTMSIGGDLSTNTASGMLRFNGNRLSLPGQVAIQTGSRLVMTSPADSLLVGGNFDINSDAGNSTLSAGVIVASGDHFYLQKTGSGSTGTHRIVLNATGAGLQDLYVPATDGVRNLDVSSGRNVRFLSGMQITGDLRITTPVTVTATTTAIGGILSTVAGSLLDMSGGLTLTDASGTSQMLGGYRTNSNTRFLAGSSSILARNGATDSLGYRSVEVVGAGTVTGGALKISGDLLLPNSTSTLTLPDGSSIGNTAEVYGTLTFAGGATGGSYLNVHPGGTATAQGSTQPVDWTNIQLYGATGPTSVAVLNNPFGSATAGFRVLAPLTSHFFQNGGTVSGQPVNTHP